MLAHASHPPFYRIKVNNLPNMFLKLKSCNGLNSLPPKYINVIYFTFFTT